MSADLVRYRPVSKGKEAEMRPDQSGDWTSLTCYYLLHDRLSRTEEHLKAAIAAAEANRNLVKQLKDQLVVAKAEVERLRAAGDEMDAYLKRIDGTTNGMLDCRRAWLAAKEGR